MNQLSFITYKCPHVWVNIDAQKFNTFLKKIGLFRPMKGPTLDLRKYKLHSAKGKGDYFYISSAVAAQQEMQGRQQENIPDIWTKLQGKVCFARCIDPWALCGTSRARVLSVVFRLSASPFSPAPTNSAVCVSAPTRTTCECVHVLTCAISTASAPRIILLTFLLPWDLLLVPASSTAFRRFSVLQPRITGRQPAPVFGRPFWVTACVFVRF